MTTVADHFVAALRRSAEGLMKNNISDPENVLTRLVAAATQTVPGADAGGISRTGRGTIHAGHATHDIVRELDQLQHELRQGPSVDAADDPPPGGVVTAHDLAAQHDTDRWPHFASTAVRYGFRSLMSATLTTNASGRHAALNLYSHQPHAFDDQAEVIAGLFAAQASLMLYGAERAAHLERALNTRDVIGQAKGILMERFTINEDDAFNLLVTSSQNTNLKLATVARWLTNEANTMAPGPAHDTTANHGGNPASEGAPDEKDDPAAAGPPPALGVV